MREFDVVVIGSGPGGLAAAAHAAADGATVALVDDNPRAGGQIWRNATGATSTFLAQLNLPNVTIIQQARVVAANAQTLLIETPEHSHMLQYSKLILATGARELFVPFRGWTLPNVMGAGGLQALVKSGLPVAGKRVVVAGSGALLLAVAALLASKGADVRLVAEQTSWRKLARFGVAVASDPTKRRQALDFAATLRGVPIKANCWITQAHGDDVLTAVTLQSGGKTWREECDYVACGWGLLPNLELAHMLGCEIKADFVAVDATQHTSINNVYAVGEITGIGGVEKAVIEGTIAGLCATNQYAAAEPFVAKQSAQRAFVALLADTFRLRPEIKQLADEHTIVCRCEDVRYGELAQHTSWRSAKLHTRCGMGVCQGRICGGATSVLFDWQATSVRPPVAPARLETLLEWSSL